MYTFNLSYKSTVLSRKEKKDREEKYWKNHKLLTRAFQFAEGKYKELLESEYRRLMQTLGEHIIKAQQQEKRDEEDLRKHYATFLTECDVKVEKEHILAVEEREHQYQRACKKQEKASNVYEFYRVIAAFKIQGLIAYKDSVRVSFRRRGAF